MRIRPTGLALIVLLAGLAPPGCHDPNLGDAVPVMQIGQERIEFGAVAVGDELSRSITIQNAGTGPLSLTGTIADDPAGAFLVTGVDTPVPAGASGTVEVTFRPPDIARYTGQLVLRGNDRATPSGQVLLGGDGYRRGAIEVDPLEVDFGTVEAGQVALGQVTIRNVGNGDLIVSDISLTAGTDPDFRIQSSTRTPATLVAGDEVSLLLAYRPGLDSEPPREGELLISAVDPFQPETPVRLLARLNQAPLADAGPDQEVDPLQRVVLDGGASSDPDGDLPLTYAWRLARVPEGSGASLETEQGVQTTFVPDLVGVYEAELYVTDSTGLRSLLPDRVTVTALPAEKLLAELVWDSPIADLDLHMLAPGGSLGGRLDCHWGNPAPDWGVAGETEDDPGLLRDDLAGFGPETIGYGEPLDGAYTFVVDFFAAHTPDGREPTDVTLRLFVDGFLAAEITRELTEQNQRWLVARVQWPEGTVELLDQLE